MKLSLPNALTTRFARTSLIAQKNSPQILFYSGLGLMAATVVTACRGTLRLEETIAEIQEARNEITWAIENETGLTDREANKLNMYVTGKGVAKIARLYLPALSLGVAAVACLTSSHNQLTRRNAGLSAALAATERALDSYRGRVREAYGDERELELFRGEKTEKHPILDEDGRETKSKKSVKVGGGHSPYARIWGRDTSTEYDPRPEYNLAKLRSTQEYCTMLLNSRGHLFLNEVLDELGLERMPAGQVVGWLSTKYGGTDGYVDIGVLKQGDEPQFVDFLTGDEDHILLDFNVDGEVWKFI